MLDPVRVKAKTIALTAGAFFGGVILASAMEWTAGSQAATLLQRGPASQEVRPVAELSDAFISISESVTPSVVSIQTERTQRLRPGRGGGGGGEQPPIPEQFRRFFRIPEGMDAVPQQAGGSGFLISSDGYIMTNNHVVEGADRIRVALQDRRVFQAEVVGRDPNTDIAVIRVQGRDFPAVRFGNPQGTRVGEWVLAIGNPLGLDFTVTAGIVSAQGRPLNIIQATTGSPYAIESFIQTDAAINPGNSGGPLVNLRGEVIGVNSAIASQSGFYEGYGFAVPIDLARRVADDLIRYGKVRRPILGVSIGEVTVEDAEVYRLPAVAGVVVQDFSSDDSPARRAGLRPGDVIIAIDGEPVSRINELQRRVANEQPGTRVRLDVVRYGERMTFDVQLTEAETAPVAAAAAPTSEPSSEGRLGITVAPLTAELAAEYEYSQPGGLVVTEVQPFGPVARVFNARGWKVVQIDRQDVSDVAQFERVIRGKTAGAVVSLTLEAPDGTRRIVNVRIPS